MLLSDPCSGSSAMSLAALISLLRRLLAARRDLERSHQYTAHDTSTKKPTPATAERPATAPVENGGVESSDPRFRPSPPRPSPKRNPDPSPRPFPFLSPSCCPPPVLLLDADTNIQ